MDRKFDKQIKQTKIFLEENEHILVTRANKSNTTLILNKSDYINKVNDLLNDTNSYKKLNANPESKLRHDSFKLMDSWKKNNFSGGNIKRRDIPNENTLLPRLYGLPKKHKSNCPVEPVVSQINSPTYFMT